MSVMPYDSKRCSLFRLANLDELPSNKRINKGFFSDTITQSIRRQRSHETNPTDAGLCAELSRLAYFKFEDSDKKKKELATFFLKIGLNLVLDFSKEDSLASWILLNNPIQQFEIHSTQNQ